MEICKKGEGGLQHVVTGMDPAEKFWGGEVARRPAEEATFGVRGRSPRKFLGFFARYICRWLFPLRDFFCF